MDFFCCEDKIVNFTTKGKVKDLTKPHAKKSTLTASNKSDWSVILCSQSSF